MCPGYGAAQGIGAAQGDGAGAQGSHGSAQGLHGFGWLQGLLHGLHGFGWLHGFAQGSGQGLQGFGWLQGFAQGSAQGLLQQPAVRPRMLTSTAARTRVFIWVFSNGDCQGTGPAGQGHGNRDSRATPNLRGTW